MASAVIVIRRHNNGVATAEDWQGQKLHRL